MKINAPIALAMLAVTTAQADLGSFISEAYTNWAEYSDRRDNLPTQEDAIKQLDETIGKGSFSAITARLKEANLQYYLENTNVKERLDDYAFPEELLKATAYFLRVDGPQIQRKGASEQVVKPLLFFDDQDELIEWRFYIRTYAS